MPRIDFQNTLKVTSFLFCRLHVFFFSNPDSSIDVISYQSFNIFDFIYCAVNRYGFRVMLRARHCNVHPLRHAQNTPSDKAVCFDC